MWTTSSPGLEPLCGYCGEALHAEGEPAHQHAADATDDAAVRGVDHEGDEGEVRDDSDDQTREGLWERRGKVGEER